MKHTKKLLSLVLCFALMLSCYVGIPAASASAAVTPNTKYSSDEVILHCWNWPISTIKAKLQDIADAGYTAVQTSPINALVGYGNTVDNWYQFYQPINYTIGNKICTEAEFKSFCDDAHDLRLKVIVDVVLNHTTNQTDMVDSDLTDYHGNGNIDNWDDRKQQTQRDITNMPDLNTSNTTIQTKARAMLEQMLVDGADGFRFDAAKHIELPEGEEISGCPTSNYWPNVLNNLGDKFSYGEVLAGQNCPLYNYSKYMNVTGSAYSDTIRRNITNNVLNVNDGLSDYQAGLGGNNLVCWVESHDTYRGDAQTYKMPEEQVKLAWAAITAQNLNTLFLARPYGATTSNWKGSDDTTLGGDGFYFDPEIAEVNKFHNAAKGQGVNVYNVNGDTTLFAVSRGSTGVCLINTSESAKSVSVGTSLPNGSYTTACGSTFTVSNGTLSGSIPAKSVASVFDGASASERSYYVVGGFNGWNNSTAMTANGANVSWTTTLAADSYEFKIKDSSNNWYGNEGTINDTASGWDMSTTAGNCTLKATGGKYTFTFNTSTKKLSVTKEQGETETGSETVTSTETETVTETTVVEGKKATLSADEYTKGDEDWYAYTWDGNGNDRWIKGANGGTFTGLYNKVIFARVEKDKEAAWANVWNQTEDLDTVDGGTFTVTGWNNGNNKLDGSWTEIPTETVTETETETVTETETNIVVFEKSMRVDTTRITGDNIGSHWAAWTWNDGEQGEWRQIEKFGYVATHNNVLFVNYDTDTPDWGTIAAQTTDFTVQDGKLLTLLNEKDSQGRYLGDWEQEPTVTETVTETETETETETTVVEGKSATLSADEYTKGDEDWYAYTWDGNGNDRWIKGVNGGTFTGLYDNVIFARVEKDKEAAWANVWNQTEDQTTVDGGTFTITSWDGGQNSKMTGTWSTPSNVKGDADGNGTVNINDVTYAQRILLGYYPLTDEKLALLDVNKDGKFTIRDVTLIQMYVAHMIDSLD